MEFFGKIRQRPEHERRAMMLVTMLAISSVIVYAWFHSLDLGGVVQNPIDAVSQAGNTKNEISPLQSLWIEAQIFGGQLRQIGSGLKSLAQGKIPEIPIDATKVTNVSNDANGTNVANDTNVLNAANEPKVTNVITEENKKSFFGTIKDVIAYNIGILGNILHF